jgi:hypothetical protein
MGNLSFLEGMTMRNLMWSALAGGFLLAGASVALASDDDTVKLGGPYAIQGSTDTDLVRGGGHGGGGHGGGGHGGYGHGGYGHGGYYGGGYRGGYYGGGYGRGYYGGYYGGGYYPYYYGAGYWPYYYGSYYYPPTYYQPSVYYYPTTSYYYPMAGSPAPTMTLQGASNYQPAPGQYVPQAPAGGDGTFPYDGGPRNVIPVPMPGDTNPAKNPGVVPLDGKLVSSPTKASGGIAPVSTPEIQRLNYVGSTSATPARVTYPAYGDEPLPVAPRKTAGR